MKNKEDVKLKRTDHLETLKMEIAEELGLIDYVRKKGWHALSAKEAGRIGGMMTQRQKAERNKTIQEGNKSF